MKLIKYSLIVILSLFSLNLFAETSLTEQSVSKMLKVMEEAVKAQDAENLISHFSKEAKITFEMPANMGGKMEMDVTGYKSILLQAWALPAKYTYDSQDLVITVASDGKSAIATDVTIETLEVNGKVIMSSKTREDVTVKLFNGIPKITDLYAKVEM